MLITSASLAAQTQALEIDVAENGRISIFQTKVLGESTDRMVQNQPNRNSERTQPVNQIAPRANQRIEFKRSGDAVQVDVVQELPTTVQMPVGVEAQKAQELQRFEAKRLTTTLPAARKMHSQDVQVQQQNELYKNEADTIDVANIDSAAQKQEYLTKVQQQRAERVQEQVELRKANQEGVSQAQEEFRSMRIRNGIELPEEADFELKSRNTMARIRNSAVTFDPETNSISVVTPSGVTKELHHLPDQAIERIKQYVLVADQASLEVIPTEDGSVYYRTISERPVRVLGLFPRQIQTEIMLNDETGDVSERIIGTQSMFSRLLNMMSF